MERRWSQQQQQLPFGGEAPASSAIVCKDIPAQYNDKASLRAHFSRYGSIVKILSSPEKMQASVYFESRASAASALKNGKLLAAGDASMKIFWKRPVTRTSSGDYASVSRSLSQSTDEVTSPTGHGSVALPQPSSSSTPAMLFGKRLAPELSPKRHSPELSTTDRRTSALATGSKAMPVSSGLFGKGVGSQQAFAAMSAADRSSDNLPLLLKRQDMSPPVEASAALADKLHLSQLKGTVAATTEERYRILDEFDKRVKKGLQRRSDISQARATVGSCPDMCPEKERYMRDFQRRVHAFETIPGTESSPQMDHSRAVKEYSRSSADQEEPLPSELRPAHVLAHTMDYLVATVMNAGGSSSSWEDWYDFLWDRTRGIRKDITQQHLCDDTAVGLVEKCARFHIYCAERLCEETAQAFDQKINDENLTKCLQTLREMYEDLRRARMTPCPNEAEFRGYMVLMKLNEGDTLRVVQQLEPDIRNSREMQFVLAVYASLESSNYVRFFKLLKGGTFLNACIMHRYFGQIRLKAVEIMIKAYKDRSAKFPLDEFVRILNFEDGTEAIEFCLHIGLSSTTQEGVILLRSADYVAPEAPPLVHRAISLIERKLTTSVGQAVYGGPLPEVVLSIPHSSFDKDSRFTCPNSDGYASHADSYVLSAASCEPLASTIAATEEAQRYIVSDVCISVTDELTKGVAEEVLQHTRLLLAMAPHAVALLVDEVIGICVQEIAREAYQELCTEHEAKLRKAEVGRVLDFVATTIMDDLFGQVIAGDASAIALDVFRAATEERRRSSEELADCASSVVSTFINEEASHIAETLARDFYRSHVVERLAMLERCVQRFTHRCQRLILARWRQALVSRRRLRLFLLDFPSGPCLCAPAAAGSKTRPMRQVLSADLDGLNCTRQRLKLDASILAKRLKLACAVYPLNVAQIIAPVLVKKMESATVSRIMCCSGISDRLLGNMLCFKLMMVLPGYSEMPVGDGVGHSLCELVVQKLSYGPAPAQAAPPEVAPLLHLHSVSCSRWQVSACVRAVGAALTPQSAACIAASGQCRGTTAMLYLLPEVDFDVQSTPSLRRWSRLCLDRLALALAAKPAAPALPLLVLVPVPGGGGPAAATAAAAAQGKLKAALDFLSFIEQQLLSHVHVAFINVGSSEMDISDVLTEGLLWLAANMPDEPRVCCTDAVSLVDVILAKEFYVPVYEDLAARQRAGLPHQDPGCLLSLYNGIVKQLAKVADQDRLAQVSWPPPELCLDMPELPFRHARATSSGASASEYLRELCLPALGRLPASAGNPDAVYSWPAACQDVCNYVSLVCGGYDCAGCTMLLSRIRSLLKKSMQSAIGFADDDDGYPLHHVDGTLANVMTRADAAVPWTDIIAACVEHRVSTQLSGGIKVWYLTDDLELVDWRQLRKWPLICRSWAGDSQGDEASAAGAPVVTVPERRYGKHEQIAGNPTPSLAFDPSSVQHRASTLPAARAITVAPLTVPGFQESLISIRQAIADEKMLNDDFEKLLMRMLQGNPPAD